MVQSYFSSLTVRVSAVLLLALVSIVGTTGIFWLYLNQNSDVPGLLDDLGRQRMLSMKMVASAHQWSDDSKEAEQNLRAAADQFDETLSQLEADKDSPVLSPHCEQLTAEAADIWDEVESDIDVLLDETASENARETARTRIIDNGPTLAEASDRLVGDLRAHTEQSDRRMWWVMLGAVSFHFALFLMGIFVVRRSIASPLHRLNHAARQLRHGHFDTRVDAQHKSEIGVLEDTFNDMAAEIEQLVETLEKERELARSIVIHAPAGVVVHHDGKVLFSNAQLLSMLDVERDFEFNQVDRLLDGFCPGDRKRARELLFDLSAEDSARQDQLQLCSTDDEVQPVEVVSVPIAYHGDGAVLTVIRDISERQRLTARMMQMDRVMAIGTLVAGIGHEINNPLSFVTANLEYAIRNLQDGEEAVDPEVPAALDESLEGARRIRDIVAQLRSFTAGSDGNRRRIDVSTPLNSAIRMAKSEIRHRAQLQTHLEEVPPISGNESKLAQVFLNLLINAAHAIEVDDGDDDTITIDLFTDDDDVVVEIRDTGCGIDDETAERLFDPFFTTKEPGEGTGLGLPICQKIIEEHDGVVTFESEIGRGTTFRVSIPRIDEVRDPPSTEAKDEEPSETNERIIAVVDDEPMVGKYFERTLRDRHEVDVYTASRSFLEAIEDGRSYDVVFCDLMMPHLNGMELYDNIQSHDPELASRMVFITGGAVTAAARDFVATVDPPLLYKPFSLDKLQDIVADVELHQS